MPLGGAPMGQPKPEPEPEAKDKAAGTTTTSRLLDAKRRAQQRRKE